MDREYLNSHVNQIMETDVYKRVRIEVDSIVNRVRVSMSLEKDQYPKLKDRNILPIFWFDFANNKVVFNKRGNTYSYRKGQDFYYLSSGSVGDIAKGVV